MKSLPLGLLGAGRMGRLHARIYSQIPGVELTGICDIDPSRAAVLAEEFHARVFDSPQALAPHVQAVSIATPTDTHFEIASCFLKLGIPTLIEKPLACSSDQARQIVSLAQEHSTFVQVGHTERLNPAILALKCYSFRPRFIEAVRVSPFPFRSTDIGAVMDLMIHDIDLVLHLVGAEPTDVQAVGAAVLAQNEDLADARLTFPDGCVAKLTCSRLALTTRRTFQIFSDHEYFSLDLHAKTGFVISKSDNALRVQQALKKLAAGQVDGTTPQWTDLIKSAPLAIEDAEPMRLQLENFIASVRRQAQPIVTGPQALAAITVAEAILQAINAPRP